MAKYLCCSCGWKTKIPYNTQGHQKKTEAAYSRLKEHSKTCLLARSASSAG